MTESIIEIKHLKKSFRDNEVLKDIDFAVKKRRSGLHYRFLWFREIHLVALYQPFGNPD